MYRKRKSKEEPSFFKVLSNMDFKKLLRLPPTFLRRYDEFNLCGNVKLRVDDDSGTRWNVKLERSNNGTLCFTDGWRKFAEDAALRLGEFLVFSLLAKSDFKVVIYETSFCQREIIIPTPRPSSSSSSSTSLAVLQGMATRPSFYKNLTDTSLLRIPQGFIEKYGDIFRSEMEVRNAMGGTWQVLLEKVEDGGECLTSGWSEFCRDMGFEISELLLFSYAGDATFDVSVYAATALEKVSHVPAFDKPRCHVTLKHHHYPKFHVPGYFAKEAGLKGKKRVSFEYCPGGPRRQVNLNWFDGRISLGSGWPQFWKENNLTIGKDYTFKFIPEENLIRVSPNPYPS